LSAQSNERSDNSQPLLTSQGKPLKKGGTLKPKGRTGGQSTLLAQMRSRAAQNRLAHQEALREKMDATRYLNSIEKKLIEINRISTTLQQRKIKILIKEEKAYYDVKLSALGKAIDVEFRKLAKVLPDLKAIQLEDGATNPLGSLLEVFKRAVHTNS